MALTSEQRLEALRKLKEMRQLKEEFAISRNDPVSGAEEYFPVPERTTLAQDVGTGLDVAAGALEGFPRSVAAGVAGIASEALPGGMSGAERVEKVQSGHFFPMSQQGKEVMTDIGEFLAPLEKYVDTLAEKAGNPLVSTAIYTAIFGVPEVVGLRTGVVRRIALNKKIHHAEDVADELGLNLNSPDLPDEIIKTADNRTITVKGEGVSDLQNALRAEREKIRAQRNELYEQAENKRAALRPPAAEELGIEVRLALTKRSARTGQRKSFDVEAMPDVKRRLDDFETLSERSANYGEPIQIGEFYNLRRRINDNKPNDGSPQDSALTVMKKELDEFLVEKMVKDFVEGDQTVIEAHRKAIAAHQDLKARFDDDATIKKIIDAELSQEELTNVLIGAEKAKASSGRLVGRIKHILGPDHPAIEGIRQEILLPIVEPLLRTSPSFRQFSKNVDRLLRNNPTLVKEITPESLQPLIDLKKISDATIKTGIAPGFDIDIAKSMSRVLFGHAIARAALKVSLGAQAISLMKTLSHAQQKALMAELLGYNPYSPVIPLSSVAAGGIVADQIERITEQ